MATTEEIEHRVREADAARSTQRSAAAKRIGELAQRRAEIAEQLADIERELGDVLVEAGAVMEVDELARFTDIPAADLNRWRGNRKAVHPKRKKPARGTSGTKTTASRAPSTGDIQAADQAPARREPSASRDEPVTAEVG